MSLNGSQPNLDTFTYDCYLKKPPGIYILPHGLKVQNAYGGLGKDFEL